MGSAGLTGAEVKDDAGAAGFLACFGFFFSRLLRCWPLAMAALLMNVNRRCSNAIQYVAAGAALVAIGHPSG
jgi:hypothetical protein